MDSIKEFIHKKRNEFYNSEELLEFLEILKNNQLLSDEIIFKISKQIEGKELREIIKILSLYELTTWLERPIAGVLLSYFGGSSLLKMYTGEGSIENITQNGLGYIASMGGVIMILRHITLRILTHNSDIPHKKSMIWIGTQPFATTFSYAVMVKLYLEEYKDFFKIFRVFHKYKGEIQKILEEKGDTSIPKEISEKIQKQFGDILM